MTSPMTASHGQSGAELGVTMLVLNAMLAVLPRAWPAVPLPQRSAVPHLPRDQVQVVGVGTATRVRWAVPSHVPKLHFPQSSLVYMAMFMGGVMRYSNTFKAQVKNFTVLSFFSVSSWRLGIVARL